VPSTSAKGVVIVTGISTQLGFLEWSMSMTESSVFWVCVLASDGFASLPFIDDRGTHCQQLLLAAPVGFVSSPQASISLGLG
jgi:UDP-N-acetylmuramyl pentapeptide phosphotransferase/UDP-N-acetylglucosamine-1-phosphate transferase